MRLRFTASQEIPTPGELILVCKLKKFRRLLYQPFTKCLILFWACTKNGVALKIVEAFVGNCVTLFKGENGKRIAVKPTSDEKEFFTGMVRPIGSIRYAFLALVDPRLGMRAHGPPLNKSSWGSVASE
jgi:hypothetical protein